jgi:hypothetical protein
MIALSQILVVKNVACKILGCLTFFVIVVIYTWQAPDIFEIHASKMSIMEAFSFSEQVCLSEAAPKGLRIYPDPGMTSRGRRLEPTSLDSVIQIYPGTWKMVVPSSLIDKSNCSYVNLDDADIADIQDSYKMQPSQELNIGTPIKLSMTHLHQDKQTGLKRIGVRFGTYARKNPGDAELHLKGSEGVEFIQLISLLDLTDNKYHYFNLDSKQYKSGEIVSTTGGGVSTWESHRDTGGINTCIVYEYNNGKKSFTPGCPLF